MFSKRMFLGLMICMLGAFLSGCQTGSSKVNTTESQTQNVKPQNSEVSSEEVLSMEEFGEAIIAVLAKDKPEYEFNQIEGNTISVCEAGEEFLVLNLENAYNEYTVKGHDLTSVLGAFTNAALVLLQEEDSRPTVSRENIMATIKPADYIEFVREQGIEPVCDEFLEGLYILYMQDMPKMARPFTEEELNEAGIARSEVRELAVQNLSERLIPLLEINEVDGVYLTYADGMYESGLLLCDIWDLYPIENDYVIGIPDRSFLILADSKDVTAIEDMKTSGEYLYSEASYPITDRLIYRTGSEFSYFTK